ncbi:MAG: hypothetical protein U0S48_04070 [Solirubrobacteraceae bacterium]
MSADQIHIPTSAAPPPEPAAAGPALSSIGPSPSPAERPELQIGAAFAGGLLAALILKRIVP